MQVDAGSCRSRDDADDLGTMPDEPCAALRDGWTIGPSRPAHTSGWCLRAPG